jgi:hypothetical protein
MPSIDLNARAKEIFNLFPSLYGKVKLDDRGEPDMAAYVVSLIAKLGAGFNAKYAKQAHPLWEGHLEDEILITEAYIILLHMSASFDLILDNKKIVGKNRNTVAGQLMDMVNTLSKLGKASLTISDHSLASSALNQLLTYADRNSYEIDDVYQKMVARLTAGETTESRLAS